MDDVNVRYVAHLLTHREAMVNNYDLAKDVFGEHIYRFILKLKNSENSTHEYSVKEEHEYEAAVEWAHMRAQGPVTDAIWNEIVLKRDRWWVEDRSGIVLPYLLTLNEWWEANIINLIYGRKELGVVAGVVSDPMIPHYVDWDVAFPEWCPFPAVKFHTHTDGGLFSFTWAVMIIPLSLTPTLSTLMIYSGHPLPVGYGSAEELSNSLEAFQFDDIFKAEIALSFREENLNQGLAESLEKFSLMVYERFKTPGLKVI